MVSSVQPVPTEGAGADSAPPPALTELVAVSAPPPALTELVAVSAPLSRPPGDIGRGAGGEGGPGGRLAFEPLQLLVIDLQIRIHILHIVIVIERIEQLQRGNRIGAG